MHTFLILHLTPLDLHASVLGSEEKNMDASMRVTGQKQLIQLTVMNDAVNCRVSVGLTSEYICMLTDLQYNSFTVRSAAEFTVHAVRRHVDLTSLAGTREQEPLPS